MKASLGEGEDTYNQTQMLSTQVLESTSPAGCDRIRQEMQILKEEMDCLHSNVSEADSGLQLSLSSIEEFDTEHEQFLQWLMVTEDKVKASSQSTEYQAPAQVETDYEVSYVLENSFFKN